MTKSKQKTLKNQRSDEEARKEASIQRDKEELCRTGLIQHFNGILTISETQRLMKDVFNLEVKSLWEDRWRVNVWTKTQDKDSFTPTYAIKTSFFVVWSDEFGVTYCNPDLKDQVRRGFSTERNVFK
jgi:hypothetical protein